MDPSRRRSDQEPELALPDRFHMTIKRHEFYHAYANFLIKHRGLEPHTLVESYAAGGGQDDSDDDCYNFQSSASKSQMADAEDKKVKMSALPTDVLYFYFEPFLNAQLKVEMSIGEGSSPSGRGRRYSPPGSRDTHQECSVKLTLPDDGFINRGARNLQDLVQFVEDTMTKTASVGDGKLRVRFIENYSASTTIDVDKRPFSTLCLPEELKTRVVSRITRFLGKRERYEKKRIPHRLGLLLTGPPGTGKTTTVNSIATEFGLKVRIIDLEGCSRDMRFLMSSVTPRTILVFENIDRYGFAEPKGKGKEDGDDDDVPTFRGRRFGPPTGADKLTLQKFEEMLDYIKTHSVIVVFTSNHPENIPAPIRRRVDLAVEYPLAAKAQLGEMFKRFFENATPDQVNRFVAAVGFEPVALSFVEKHLVSFDETPEEAIENVGELLQQWNIYRDTNRASGDDTA